MKTEVITLPDTDGMKVFEAHAEIFGALAVHEAVDRCLNSTKPRWTISHVKTGGVAWRCESKQVARKAATELAKLDWSKLHTARSKKALAVLGPQVRAVITAIILRSK